MNAQTLMNAVLVFKKTHTTTNKRRLCIVICMNEMLCFHIISSVSCTTISLSIYLFVVFLFRLCSYWHILAFTKLINVQRKRVRTRVHVLRLTCSLQRNFTFFSTSTSIFTRYILTVWFIRETSYQANRQGFLNMYWK